VLRLLRLRTRLPNQSFLPLGQWLEQWEGHRLPELWSVVCGELALVGVKPLTAAEESHLTEEWQMVRYQIAAGFTGLWYSQPNPEEQFDLLCMADSYQAATDSWQQALMYLGRTPLAWFRLTARRTRSDQVTTSAEVRSQPVVQ
jgi:lipopolysaccharide/colanic/teichoic acid biosynthesis glycosyltransferase